MEWARYLPSANLVSVACAVAVAAGIIYTAHSVATPPPATSALSSSSDTTNANTDWQSELSAVAQSSGVSLPPAPSQSQVNGLLSSAQSANLTQTVGRSLLINLAAAKAQGLGDDTPTEDQIVAQAQALAASSTPATYTAADLTVVADTKTSEHAYGNAVIQALVDNPNANSDEVLWAGGEGVDYQDQTKMTALKTACPAFDALAKELAATPVPQTLAPLHLETINAIAAMGSSCADIEAALADPLRGLNGFQQFENSNTEATNVLTTIAESLNTNGILFSKDEPGSAWSAFLSSPAQ